MQITAAVVRDHKQPLVVEDGIELDELKPNEARVRIVAAGICHTDAVVRDGVYPTPLPAVLGHEGAGIVEAVGEAVTNVKVGDHVALGPAYCGTCNQCRSGNPAYCENVFAEDFGGRRRDGSTALSKNGEQLSSHFFGQSSFATHANVVQESLIVLDKDVPLELVGPLGCGFNTGAGAVLNELRPAPGTTLAVFGTGAVGSAAIMAAKISGCTTIVALDIHDSRLETAMELGATHTINSREIDAVVDGLMKITGGEGINFAIDTTGIPVLLTRAAQALAKRGTLATVASTTSGTEVPFEIGDSLVKGWTFKTIIEGSSVPQVFIPRLVQLWKRGDFPFDRLVKYYEFDDINQGFVDSANGTVIKPIVRLPQ
ncbi:NAD(P)-dependent alcohol dehydrogenase [Rothia uropygialis]|uniref:NAD(P)-dependent alcohol dehydrogenase n=1 Tax=Kocuria sp. 36 TaxID=1415402 RepID=UPI00101C7DCC|nr:NAD(P)-dependent alcohol dehydrogenase [Kocuria sp. 36]